MSLVARSTQISKQEHERLAVTAVNFARRVRYLETRSVNLEGSAAWQKIVSIHGCWLPAALRCDGAPDLAQLVRSERPSG